MDTDFVNVLFTISTWFVMRTLPMPQLPGDQTTVSPPFCLFHAVFCAGLGFRGCVLRHRSPPRNRKPRLLYQGRIGRRLVLSCHFLRFQEARRWLTQCGRRLVNQWKITGRFFVQYQVLFLLLLPFEVPRGCSVVSRDLVSQTR